MLLYEFFVNPTLQEHAAPALGTLYFFDLSNTDRSFHSTELGSMGLRQTQKGKWYYRPGRDASDYLIKNQLDYLTKTLNSHPRAWNPPQSEGMGFLT